ncbi:MAG: response regulator [Sphingobacteriales bacterium]
MGSLLTQIGLRPGCQPVGWMEFMDQTFSTIRGLINDLVRPLTAAMVHLDDLLLNFDQDLNEYDDALLANQQLGRALKYFFEIRSEILSQKKAFNKNCDNYCHSLADEADHTLGNIITLVNVSCEILLNNTSNSEQIKIIRCLYKSMDHYRQIINQNMSLISENPAVRKNEVNQYKKQGKFLKKILVIEDDFEVRNVINIALHYYGYEVFDCGSGEEGLSLFETENGNFVLSIVDIILPGINGSILGSQLLKKNPDIKFIFTSGYDKPQFSGCYMDNVNYILLSKPFSLQTLLKNVIKLTIEAPILSIPCPMTT